MSIIEFVPYNKNWPMIFNDAACEIKKILEDNLLSIHHVGSTAVPGLCSKPRIDIIIIVKELIATIQPLENLAYKYKGEINIPLHLFFSKNDGLCGFNLHVYEGDNAEIELNISFRDFLRSSEQAKNEYANIKNHLINQQSLHAKTKLGFSGYNLGKNDFIQKTLNHIGFNGICLRFCWHYLEWENFHRIYKEYLLDQFNINYDDTKFIPGIKNQFYFVLYKGTVIVGIAHIEITETKEAIIHAIAIDKKYSESSYYQFIKNRLEIWLKKWNYQLIEKM
jgi:GrpB-like predicted nucleotidyltransferase (UPF0157 family)